MERETDPNLVAFGAEVRRLRKEKRLTQKQLGEKIGVCKSAICMIEHGHRLPAFHRYGAFAAALGRSPVDLIKVAYGEN